MPKFEGRLKNYPARALLFWYLGLIAAGTLLLLLPACREASAPPLSFSDAAFTAASASCVTGLVVRSTPHDFSFWGELTIAALMQLGGIGIMTIATLILVTATGGAGLGSRLAASEALGAPLEHDIRGLLKRVIATTLAFEAAGALLLTLSHPGQGFWNSLWWGAFHSISAFCNAGFALQDDSLCAYAGNIPINLTMMALIIAGGLGYPVLLDLARTGRRRPRRFWQRLRFHTKLMLSGTAIMLVLSAALIGLLERGNALQTLSAKEATLAVAFQAATPRTAGFNTLPMNELTNATLFVIVICMFIGGGACSTAGGLKVTTAAVIALEAVRRLRGKGQATLFRRGVTPETIAKAVVTLLLFLAAAVLGLTVLLLLESAESPHTAAEGTFLDAQFEVVSALGTVGLSTGLTPALGELSRWVVILLMLVGRIGPVSVFAVLAKPEAESKARLAAGGVLIG